MKHFRSNRFVRVLAVLLPVLLFASQNRLFCSESTVTTLSADIFNPTMIQAEKGTCEFEAHTMGIDCSHLCHFNPISAPSPQHMTSLVPRDYPMSSSQSSSRGMVDYIFHPPALF